ncbi:hypothetical protein ALC56_13672 [Trachymyrmex septentrionalis]|uniref:Uncharacterized protein n=1 Tax=Trachymyrmex septentrionalis TaxID=34720 RepID=A0A195EVK4_9HYME|nr:hypothetical protein ALC56_13672 [Trachymyrmex septentrionalis]
MGGTAGAADGKGASFGNDEDVAHPSREVRRTIIESFVTPRTPRSEIRGRFRLRNEAMIKGL